MARRSNTVTVYIFKYIFFSQNRQSDVFLLIQTGQMHIFSLKVKHCFSQDVQMYFSHFDMYIYVFLVSIFSKFKLHKPPPTLSPEDRPGVSIIKPLVGVDSNLYYNLETFFKIDYPAVSTSFVLSFARVLPIIYIFACI